MDETPTYRVLEGAIVGVDDGRSAMVPPVLFVNLLSQLPEGVVGSKDGHVPHVFQ